MKSVLIAGAGPSGLMAAHAALDAGYEDITIIDAKPRKPDGRTAGVFYLHDHCNIPNIPYATIQTRAIGTALEYAEKLYGDPMASTSFPLQSRFDVVYDGMYAMDWLWGMFADRITERAVRDIGDLVWMTHMFDRVVSTVPLDAIHGTQLYPSVTTFIATAPADPLLAYVEYHGELQNPLYRASSIFGREALEFVPSYDPRGKVPPEYRVHRVKKVMPTRAKFHLGHDRLLFAGRYGAWNKRTLTHNVYAQVKEWLSVQRPSERTIGAPVRTAE